MASPPAWFGEAEDFLFLRFDSVPHLDQLGIEGDEPLAISGWIVPPPKEPTKSKDDFERERVEKVTRLQEEGLLRAERIRSAMLKVPREEFIPRPYRDYAYWDVPLPLPGGKTTISCPHSYPLFL